MLMGGAFTLHNIPKKLSRPRRKKDSKEGPQKFSCRHCIGLVHPPRHPAVIPAAQLAESGSR
jgi:hypothetical protein